MLISFEGIEGSGKSTHCKWLHEHLKEKGIPALLTKEPGGTEAGQEIRKILLNEKSDLTPHAELMLYMADRAQHVEHVIKPALAAGKVVLVDRYFDSTTAYQAYGRGLDFDMVARVNKIAVDGCVPDRTFLFDLDAKDGLERARSRNHEQGTSKSEGRFEALDLGFHEKVRMGYLEMAFTDPDARFRIVDAFPSLETVFYEMFCKLPKDLVCV